MTNIVSQAQGGEGGWGNRKQHYMYRAIVRRERNDNKKQTNNSNNKKGKG